MPFEYVLRDLLARTDQGVGALFLDESGEAVDVACSDLTPTQLRIIGAYLGIYLRQLRRLAELTEVGETQLLHVAQDELSIFAVPLPEDYCLALIQRRPALVAPALRSLEEAREMISAQLFSHG